MMYARTYLSICSLFVAALVYGQQDTLSRSVTVEKEFQPVIQSAGKMNISPDRLKQPEPKVNIVFSDYTAQEDSFFSSKPMRFASQPFPKMEQPDGLLEARGGHINTYLNFKYRIPVSGKASKGVKLDVFAKHDAAWGVKTWEKSALGLNFVKQFSGMEVYFDVAGKNHFFTRYGRYYESDNHLRISRFGDLQQSDKQNIWTAAANVGVRSGKNADIQYQVQTGYQAYVLPNAVAEHQIHTEGKVEWNSEEHHFGGDLTVNNAFFSVEEGLWQGADTALRRTAKSRHGIRIHPYYRYTGERIRVKAGINMDLNIGKGQQFSSNEQISFAPSPDVEVEYRIIPSWLAVYGGAEGKFGYGTMEEFVNKCPYRSMALNVVSEHVCGYVPVEAFLGFKIRAIDNLLIDVYARYAYQKNQTVNYVDSMSLQPYGNINYFYSDYHQWKVGAEITYHYQDIIHILASANYYHWTPSKVDSIAPGIDRSIAYDRPSWDAHLRIDARIDKHWSLYSDNIFEGAYHALYMGKVEKGKAKVDINLGARYDFNDNLGVYIQLNNLINRHHDIYYTYQSHGIQGSVGASWKF